MPETQDTPLGGMGEKLRERRKTLGLTLQQVADAAGLTPGFISQIERDLAAPSITSLKRVTEVLGLDLGAFLAAPPPAPSGETRRGNRPVFALVPKGTRYERLTSTFPGSMLRSVLIHDLPGNRTEAVSHEGEEMFFILSGALTVEIEGTPRVLEAGDSIHFASIRPHATWNHTDGVTTLLHICTLDVFGDALPAHVPGGEAK